MLTAVMSSNGRITLPSRIREILRLKAGDTVEFVVDADGCVQVRPFRVDVSSLRGLLKRKGRRPVSLDAMNSAIRAAQSA